METDAVREIEAVRQHQLAVHRATPLPAWAWPSFGIGVFLFLSSYALGESWIAIGAPIAYSLFVGVWAGLIVRHTGVQGRLRGTPKPLQAEMARAWVGCALIIGGAVALGLLVSWVLAGALAGIAVLVGGRLYERRYSDRADALAGARAR
jgi:hypothetical protein